MIYDKLLADLKQIPTTPSHLDRIFDQKANVLPFLGLQTQPTPYGGNVGSLLERGCSLQKYFWFRL